MPFILIPKKILDKKYSKVTQLAIREDQISKIFEVDEGEGKSICIYMQNSRWSPDLGIDTSVLNLNISLADWFKAVSGLDINRDKPHRQNEAELAEIGVTFPDWDG